MLKFVGKLLSFALVALVLQILIVLDYAPAPTAQARSSVADKLRAISVRWPPLNTYRPDAEIMTFQRYMKTDTRMGFLFRENLGGSEPVELKWADQDAATLTTDETGFMNSPSALKARRDGKRVQIVGVGSSFMQGAAGQLHDFFMDKGAFYYNMATPRQTLPQFTTAVKEFAIREKPDWILYDLNETSCELIEDFENWSRSGLDWFTYHSGTWCGPPQRPGLPLLDHLPAAAALYHAIRRRIDPEAPIPKTSDEETVRKALGYIVAAYEAAHSNGIRFLVVVIPGKWTTIYGKGDKWKTIGALLPLLEKAGIPVLNLLDTFAKEEYPQALYYEVDAHWNDYGILTAGVAISEYLEGAGGL
jgi:hypothetical protein